MSTTAIVQSKPTREMEYVPFGAINKIKLSIEIIKNIVAVKTKAGHTCDDMQAMKFMMLCNAQLLNPFAGDAYLIGYDSKDGPVFSLITSHQAFLKRAEVNPQFDGMVSGIIIQDADDSVKEIEGDFHLPNQVVLGGWAKVFHKGRQYPTYRKIRRERFDSGYAQWQKDAAGMICKCAEADALRSTFPTLLGGLHLQGEIEVPAQVEAAPKLAQVTPETAVDTGKPGGQDLRATPVNDELADIVIKAGCSFDQFMAWAKGSGNLDANDAAAAFADLTPDFCKRMIRAKTGLLKGLAQMNGVAA